MNQRKLIKELGHKQHGYIVRDYYGAIARTDYDKKQMKFLRDEYGLSVAEGDMFYIVIVGRK